MKSKYEIIIEYEGEWEGVADFAAEIVQEFGTPVLVNEVSEDGTVLNGLMDWQDAREALHKTDTTDLTRES